MPRATAVWIPILLTAAVLGACGRDREHRPAVVLTPQAGVRTLEIAPAPVESTPPASLSGTADTSLPEPAGEAVPAAPGPIVLQPGVKVTASAAVRLYAAPDTSLPALASYPAGAQFMIVAPDGEFPEYPVQVLDAPWYRVRAEDGLVGWVPGGALAAP